MQRRQQIAHTPLLPALQYPPHMPEIDQNHAGDDPGRPMWLPNADILRSPGTYHLHVEATRYSAAHELDLVVDIFDLPCKKRTKKGCRGWRKASRYPCLVDLAGRYRAKLEVQTRFLMTLASDTSVPKLWFDELQYMAAGGIDNGPE